MYSLLLGALSYYDKINAFLHHKLIVCTPNFFNFFYLTKTFSVQCYGISLCCHNIHSRTLPHASHTPIKSRNFQPGSKDHTTDLY